MKTCYLPVNLPKNGYRKKPTYLSKCAQIKISCGFGNCTQKHAFLMVYKGMVLYSAVSSPLDRSKRFTLYYKTYVHIEQINVGGWYVKTILLCKPAHR